LVAYPVFKLRVKYNPDYWLDVVKLKSNLNAKGEYGGSKWKQMGGVIVMKTIVQYFLILISLIVASYLMGTATAKDKSEVLYLTFDDDKPKDLSPTLISHARW
tara:strand:- start:7 stop:315 length:309 start_codon:yes stop_codon:yes gene_type:complete